VAFFSRADFLKVADSIFGPPLCRLLGRLYMRRDADTGPAVPNPAGVRRILLIRPGGMGDMVVLLPALAALKDQFPRAEIDVVCEKRNLAVLRMAGFTRAALPYDVTPFRTLHRLRHTPYDLAIDTEQFHHFSAVFAALSRAPIRVGFKINPLRNPLYTHLVNYAPDGPEGVQFMRLLEPLGIRNGYARLEGVLANYVGSLPEPVEQELRTLAPSGAFVVLHPGTSSIYKQWPEGRFSRLAADLCREHSLAVAIVGDANDVPLGNRIVEDCRAAACPALSFQGRLSLSETTAVIQRARLFVGTDSGLAHLAVALGCPTVIQFGPSDALKWGVDDPTHATVRADLACAPCFIFGYHKPCRTVACMRQITVEAVLNACRTVLRNSALPPSPRLTT